MRKDPLNEETVLIVCVCVCERERERDAEKRQTVKKTGWKCIDLEMNESNCHVTAVLIIRLNY